VTLLEAIAIIASGAGAGAVNTVVGSGTLITFPVLIAFGYPPVIANVSNTVGLVPGSVSGAVAYRAELAGQKARAAKLAVASLLGGTAGGIALLALPASAFKAVVPVFIAMAVLLVALQPKLSAALARRRAAGSRGHVATALVAVFVAGIYGGYFGAAQGILLIAILTIVLGETLHRSNALKNVLGGVVNGVAGCVFAIAGDVDWGVAALIAAGSVVGAQLGGRYGRRLPPSALRVLILAVGLFAIARLTVM
jgi:uncharacterized membrane protein YfcA